jgi:hypothetical protein
VCRATGGRARARGILDARSTIVGVEPGASPQSVQAMSDAVPVGKTGRLLAYRRPCAPINECCNRRTAATASDASSKAA